MMRRSVLAFASTIVLASAGGCESCVPQPPPPQLAEGVFGPLGAIRPNASAAERELFEEGKAIALRQWTPATGLGPGYNVSSCAACHEKPAIGGSAGRYRDFNLAFEVFPAAAFARGHNGVQLDYALGDVDIGSNASGPITRVDTDGDANTFARRNPIPFFGVGLLAEIPAEEIASRADPDDSDGDGISGRINVDRGFLSRFGVKAQSASLEGFIRGPINNHAGITSDPLPPSRQAQLPIIVEAVDDDCGTEGCLNQAQVAAASEPLTDDDGVPDPEMSEDELFALVSYTMLLAAPEPDPETPASRRGREQFEAIGCTACHVPALLGPRGLIPAWTDLLVHDMGDELNDGIRMLAAREMEFRTAPLWGVAGAAPYLHDGRADTLDEAIVAHGGEALASRERYQALSADERDDVIAFLNSLGGADQTSPGMLAPNEPVRAAGELGAPVDAVANDAAALDVFVAGRAEFDREHFASEGLGKSFNGDSCRACHFQPVIGGAGPVDVNVIRGGIVDGDGIIVPAGGSMVHRHLLGDVRAPIDPAITFTVTRQTPPIFGLGLLELVPEDAILLRADPADADADGISGRAHVLADGRLGRFGWKADIPTLAAFARDAAANELGLSLEGDASADGAFGFGSDDDDVIDPEYDVGALGLLTTFMRDLAPPARVHTDTAAEARGAVTFDAVGCARCHVPQLPTPQGNIAAFTDLLLHDVARPGELGVPSGDAGPTEMRTTPLWGLMASGPWWHDGRAFSVEAAIAEHHGESAASDSAYKDHDDADRADLLAFLASL